MRNIAGETAPDGRFVGYDPSRLDAATILTPEWANDVQEDLLGIQAWASVAKAAGSQHHVRRAIQRMIIEGRYGVGDYYYSGSPRESVAWDPAKIDKYYPGVCLLVFGGVRHTDLTAAQWPQLVPILNKRLAGVYIEQNAELQTTFATTGWTVSGTAVTLSFGTNDAAHLLAPLIEDLAAHGGSYANWRYCKINRDSGTLKAGLYRITKITSKTIEIDVTGAVPTSGVSTGEAGLVSIPLHDIGGGKARLYLSAGDALLQPKSQETIPGLRHRNAIIEHTHSAARHGTGQAYWTDGQGAAGAQRLAVNNAGAEHLAKSAATGGVVSPAKGATYTRPDGLSAYLHIWGGRYVT